MTARPQGSSDDGPDRSAAADGDRGDLAGGERAHDDPGTSDTASHADAPPDGVVRSTVLRGALATAGWLCVALGAIGVILPGWPTTPWLLLAAFLFARSSPRFYRWLIDHRLFGPTVRDIRDGRGLPARTKTFAIAMTGLFAGTSALLLARTPWLGGTVAVAGLIGIASILRLPTQRLPAHRRPTHRADGERSGKASVEDDEL